MKFNVREKLFNELRVHIKEIFFIETGRTRAGKDNVFEFGYRIILNNNNEKYFLTGRDYSYSPAKETIEKQDLKHFYPPKESFAEIVVWISNEYKLPYVLTLLKNLKKFEEIINKNTSQINKLNAHNKKLKKHLQTYLFYWAAIETLNIEVDYNDDTRNIFNIGLKFTGNISDKFYGGYFNETNFNNLINQHEVLSLIETDELVRQIFLKKRDEIIQNTSIPSDNLKAELNSEYKIREDTKKHLNKIAEITKEKEIDFFMFWIRISNETNIKFSDIKDYFENLKQPSIEELFTISKYLKVQPHELLIDINYSNHNLT